MHVYILIKKILPFSKFDTFIIHSADSKNSASGNENKNAINIAENGIKNFFSILCSNFSAVKFKSLELQRCLYELCDFKIYLLLHFACHD